MVPELQMQVSQGVPALNGMSSAFNNQTIPPAVQPHPGHAQQPHQLSQQQTHISNPHPHLQGPNHTTNSQQQAYAIRLAKERQLQQQQRYLQHQQQQFATSNAMIPHAQSQHPISSPLQNSSQAQPQNSSQPVSLSPVTSSSPLTPMSSQHQQQKHHLPQHGFSRNPGASGLTNQAVKQRQRQLQQRQYQQPARQHPSQLQHAQSQQQAKFLKGIGRGNMLAHQNHSVDPSHLNGLSVPPGSQTVEKGDQIMHMMQGQNLYPGSGSNPSQSSKPSGHAHSSNHSQMQQKLHTGPANAPSKQLQPVVSPSDNSIQGPSPVSSGHIMSPPQPAVTTSNHHQLQLQSQPQSKQINQTQPNVQRMLPKNCQVHSESSSMSQSDSPQVDQHPANSASQVTTSTASQGSMDPARVATVVPTVSSQLKTSEPPFDSNTPNPVTQLGSMCQPVGNSAGNELSTISQGLGPRQLSASLPSPAHNSMVQRQQQSLPIPQHSSQAILSQQPYQPPDQQPQQELEQHSPKDTALQHQPQQKVQHLQPAQNSLLVCPPNSKVE